jgi:hypothetical protein
LLHRLLLLNRLLLYRLSLLLSPTHLLWLGLLLDVLLWNLLGLLLWGCLGRLTLLASPLVGWVCTVIRCHAEPVAVDDVDGQTFRSTDQ